jgi:hypothetical protein
MKITRKADHETTRITNLMAKVRPNDLHELFQPNSQDLKGFFHSLEGRLREDLSFGPRKSDQLRFGRCAENGAVPGVF